MGVFHHWVSLRLMGKQPRREVDGTWRDPPLSTEMAEAVQEEMETDVIPLQNTFMNYIMICMIMYLCLGLEWKPVARVNKVL